MPQTPDNPRIDYGDFVEELGDAICLVAQIKCLRDRFFMAAILALLTPPSDLRESDRQVLLAAFNAVADAAE